MEDKQIAEIATKLSPFMINMGTVNLLLDKGFEEKEFSALERILAKPNETFAQRGERLKEEEDLDMADSMEITEGRYRRYVRKFKDISSEQALVKGRLKFGIEYVIRLVDFISKSGQYESLVPSNFSDIDVEKLRSIYEQYVTKDFRIAKLLEDKINHDVVASNTTIILRAQQLGIDENIMRAVTHFSRTSADVNTPVIAELYSKAIGLWMKSLRGLIGDLADGASKYSNITCVAETHGQDAQLTTLGYIYANLAEQLGQHAKLFLGKKKFLLEGKIGGAIGLDGDMNFSIPEKSLLPLYKQIIENNFGLEFVTLGVDQDLSNVALARAFDAMSNVNTVLKKAATDTWIYASRGISSKTKSGKGESGSSAMPQKMNPFFAESAEGLVPIVNATFPPIKDCIIAYREQGDLRRSIALREAFHPIILSVIAYERLRGELKKYQPNVAQMEIEIYRAGPALISSQISNGLRALGVVDAYDRVKEIVMKPYVDLDEFNSYIKGLVETKTISEEDGFIFSSVMGSLTDNERIMAQLLGRKLDNDTRATLLKTLEDRNWSAARRSLIGHAVKYTNNMIAKAGEHIKKLERYYE